MCIACHYTGRSQLVTPQQRAMAHADGDYRCLRPAHDGRLVCVDCQQLAADRDHMCQSLLDRQVTRPWWERTYRGRRG